MPRVTEEQIAQAKAVDLLDYLQRYDPQMLKREGENRYTLRDHDSFVISNKKWCWFSRGFGCNTGTALNYLIKVRDYSFVDAVLALAGDMPYQSSRPPPMTRGLAMCETSDRLEKKPFTIPPRNHDNKRVIAYLQSRGIDKDLIMDCINRGVLYESAQYHNVVFLGKNEEGKVRFGCMRSTTGTFRRDVDGSDKRFGFLQPPIESLSRNIACFEAAIDALSHQTLCRKGIEEWDGWRLALSGGSLLALIYFLEHHPNVNNVFVCTDVDAAGQKVADKITALPTTDAVFKRVSVKQYPPLYGKDWNDALKAILQAECGQIRTNTKHKGGDAL
jgi:hypothetical protein